MAEPILTENSILVYLFAHARRKIPFENHARVHHFCDALASLFADSGKPLRKDELKFLNRPVNTNQSVRQRRIGLEPFQNFLWALMFGHYLISHRRSHAKPFRQKHC
jgi:hypothetical protein